MDVLRQHHGWVCVVLRRGHGYFVERLALGMTGGICAKSDLTGYVNHLA